ncbi:MAG TPA: helix-turn-helix transcriptional regulator [Gemmataceae bacterium]|jgi:plasmid maintenance system antidote protein VapI|nr:helix-turn-helix transcriptional regulator [Gemmataceae bacterium]
MARHPQTLAEALRQRIKGCGLSVAALSRKADIPQPCLHTFARGEQGLSLKNAEKLVAYFDLELRPRART